MDHVDSDVAMSSFRLPMDPLIQPMSRIIVCPGFLLSGPKRRASSFVMPLTGIMNLTPPEEALRVSVLVL